ncbi:MAG: regulatory protein RecX [Dehalococcoidia bacterium]
MPTITALKRGRGRRFLVFLDGRFAFALEAEVAAGLAVGAELSATEADRLQEHNLSHRCHGAALHLLSYRPRSRAELRQRLLRRGFPAQGVEEELERLAQQGLVDDAAFARSWREAREGMSPRSARLIQGELRRKGVDPEAAAEATRGLDDEEAAYRAAIKKAPRWASQDYMGFRRKAGDFLHRRGFSYEVVRHTVDRLWRETHTPPPE